MRRASPSSLSGLLTASALGLGALAASVASACGGRVAPGDESPAADDGGVFQQITPLTDAGEDASDGSLGRDAQPPVGRPTTPLERIDLGLVDPGATVTFTVPPGTVGFNVVVAETLTSGGSGVGVSTLTSPSGERAFAGYVPQGGAFETSLGETWAAASIPQPDVKPAPGAWSVRFERLGGGTQKLKAEVLVQRTPDGAFHGGALDLDLWIPDGLRVWEGRRESTLSAANAETNPWLVGRVDAFYDLLGDVVGLDRGTVRYHAIAGRFRTISESNLEDAARATEPRGAAQALHVILTEDLFDGQAAGTTTAIPGAAARGGTPVSAIASITVDEGVDSAASTWLHEGGHFLGLNHTTELDNFGADPLADTARCADTALDFDTLGRCPDRANVMFPLGPWPGDTPVVSPAQLRVYRGSPVYRAYAEGAPRATRARVLRAPLGAAPTHLPRLLGCRPPTLRGRR